MRLQIKLVFVYCFYCFFIFSNSFVLSSSDLKIDGYVKSTFSVKNVENDKTVKNLGTKLRVNLFDAIGDKVSFKIAYELISEYNYNEKNEQKSFFFSTTDISYRADDVNKTFYHDNHGKSYYSAYQNIDRLFFTISFDKADIFIGRQPVSFGSARFINPTDVLTSFSFDTIDKEEVEGVDAFRVRLPFGSMGEVDAGVIFGDDFQRKKNAAYINTKFTLKNIDYAFTAMVFTDNCLLGADFQTPFFDAGFWLEYAYVFANALDKSINKENYYSISTGFDYSFSTNFYGFIEYHLNGAGTKSKEKYLTNSDKTAYKQGKVYLLSRHYLIPGFIWQITPLSTCQTNFVINLLDYSSFFSPKLSYGLSDNFYLDAGAFVSFGKKVKMADDNLSKAFVFPDIRSEFGLYPDLYYISLRYYF